MSPLGEQHGDSLDDEDLAQRVAQALRLDPEIGRHQLKLSVQNRVVILTGHVATARDSGMASQRAWSVPGVFDVCNRIGVAGHAGPVVWDWPGIG
ncbi:MULTISPECIES: BON domain-containing protein [Actinoplanes]|uniref:BON domain-containing protein n=1 Tax=Actinoplanes TaxID=1865 RepID=UPI0005F2C62F|nr:MULTISPECIES: BON domain-containing protein [Actinoplanes]GLY02136.1 hypothetical protein Acsp01_25150 [Actinoplanes sp. NBRC 101535]